MSIEETIRKLSDLSELAEDVLEEEMSEVHLVPIKAEDLEAIRNARVTLEGLRIMMGIYAGEAEK